MFLLYNVDTNIAFFVCLYADDCILYRVIKLPQLDHLILRTTGPKTNYVVQWTDTWQMKLSFETCVKMVVLGQILLPPQSVSPSCQAPQFYDIVPSSNSKLTRQPKVLSFSFTRGSRNCLLRPCKTMEFLNMLQ